MIMVSTNEAPRLRRSIASAVACILVCAAVLLLVSSDHESHRETTLAEAGYPYPAPAMYTDTGLVDYLGEGHDQSLGQIMGELKLDPMRNPMASTQLTGVNIEVNEGKKFRDDLKNFMTGVPGFPARPAQATPTVEMQMPQHAIPQQRPVQQQRAYAQQQRAGFAQPQYRQAQPTQLLATTAAATAAATAATSSQPDPAFASPSPTPDPAFAFAGSKDTPAKDPAFSTVAEKYPAASASAGASSSSSTSASTVSSAQVGAAMDAGASPSPTATSPAAASSSTSTSTSTGTTWFGGSAPAAPAPPPTLSWKQVASITTKARHTPTSTPSSHATPPPPPPSPAVAASSPDGGAPDPAFATPTTPTPAPDPAFTTPGGKQETDPTFTKAGEGGTVTLPQDAMKFEKADRGKFEEQGVKIAQTAMANAQKQKAERRQYSARQEARRVVKERSFKTRQRIWLTRERNMKSEKSLNQKKEAEYAKKITQAQGPVPQTTVAQKYAQKVVKQEIAKEKTTWKPDEAM